MPSQPKTLSLFLHNAIHRFWSHPEIHAWLSPYQKVAVGVSGGLDSMTLLYFLASNERPDWAPQIVVAHVHHGLRGAQADADQERVRQMARSLSVPFRSRKLNGARLRSQTKGSLENTLRIARYAALRDIMDRTGCQALVVAHHQDDLAETFLLRLLRGSGLTGLAGFAPESDIEGIRIIRPLIDWTRSELRAVARAAKIPWGEDETNQDTRLMRNRIRRRILPYLERTTDHPPAARIIARTARRLERESKALKSIVESVYAKHRIERSDPRRIGLPRSAFQEHPPLVPYLLRALMCDILETPYPPSEERITEMVAFAQEASSNTLLQCAGNVVVYLAKDTEGPILWAYKKPQRNIPRSELIEVFRRL